MKNIEDRAKQLIVELEAIEDKLGTLSNENMLVLEVLDYLLGQGFKPDFTQE